MTIKSQPGPSDRDLRAASVAAHLAKGVREGDIDEADALRILRHELRRRNTNTKLQIVRRSTKAQAVIDRYTEQGQPVPNNNSPEALHADHVFPLLNEQLRTITTRAEWIEELKRVREVVCVTAEENYQLQQVERRGVHGWQKYAEAGVKGVTSWPQA
jgi:hypothetical protein